MTTWVFLRGLTRESRHWGRFPELFRAEMPAARVHLLDLPGNGRLHAARSPASVAAMAQDCREQLRRLGAPPPYHVLAMSLGAMVAVAWAMQHPQELGGCVLINTSLRPFSPFYRRLRPGNYAAVLRFACKGVSDREREQTVLRLTTRQAAADGALRESLLDDWVAWRREHPVSRANALWQLLAAARFRAPRHSPGPPVLVLTSAADGLVDTRCSTQLAAAWQCPLVRHPWAGHDLPLDDGAWVVRQVRQWLEGLCDLAFNKAQG